MGLEDFEKELAAQKAQDDEVEPSRRSKHRSRENDDRERKHHHRSHRSRRDDSRDRHRHKRHRERDDDEDGERRHRKKQRSASSKTSKKPREEEVKVFDSDDGEDEWVEKEAVTAPPEEEVLDSRGVEGSKVQRDAWMQEPSALDIEYTSSRKKEKEPKSQFVGAKESHEFKVQTADVNQHLKDLQADFDSDIEDGGAGEEDAARLNPDVQTEHDVGYEFGDSGSQWRMMKLQGVYRKAKESGEAVEDVALKTYGDLRAFDEAREEEVEVDRRKMYGREYVGKIKPSGELYEERRLKAGVRRDHGGPADDGQQQEELPQGEVMEERTAPATTMVLDATALNKLKAQMMKAKLRGASNAAQLEEEYNAASAASLANNTHSGVVVLNQMENRQLAGNRSGEVTAVTGKRGTERHLVTENEDISIEDMVKHEKRTRGLAGGEGKAFAERIAKDGKFEDDLEYLDDNASKLSKKVAKSDINLRNTAIGDFSKMQRILDSCPLCHHEDRATPSDQLPQAPVVSLATRTYLTLPTEPEITGKTGGGGAVIVPIQHRLNLLECDDDEWEEIRNFQKSLTRHYDALGLGVIFYENAAGMHSKKSHAALVAVPLPRHLVETAPAYFKEAILASDEQWSQHKPVIDTLALSQRPGYGKATFRKGLPKEMAYFHVWFGLDGGMGHVIEDERRWPKGDLFAREILGGMLDKGPEVVKRQGRWERGDRRVEGFRKRWGVWDWTKALMEAQ